MMHANGWRNVDLVSDRGAGSRPAGCRHQQNIQEIIGRTQPVCELNFYLRKEDYADQIFHEQNRQ